MPIEKCVCWLQVTLQGRCKRAFCAALLAGRRCCCWINAFQSLNLLLALPASLSDADSSRSIVMLSHACLSSLSLVSLLLISSLWCTMESLKVGGGQTENEVDCVINWEITERGYCLFSMQFMQTMCDFLLRKTIANRQHQSRRQRRETIAHQKRASLLSEIVILMRREKKNREEEAASHPFRFFNFLGPNARAEQNNREIFIALRSSVRDIGFQLVQSFVSRTLSPASDLFARPHFQLRFVAAVADLLQLLTCVCVWWVRGGGDSVRFAHFLPSSGLDLLREREHPSGILWKYQK